VFAAVACRQPAPTRSDASAAPRAVSAADDLLVALREVYAGPPAQWPEPHVDPGVEWRELGTPDPAPRWTADERLAAEVQLGRLLFHDGRLSGTGQMSCASCHAPELGWSDGRTTSLGHGARTLRRNSPGLLDVATLDHLFWDGRASSLEEQISQVFSNPMEMGIEEDRMLAGLSSSAGYRERFEAAFGDPEPTPERVVGAIATFVRTLRTEGRADFDRFLAGETDALSDSALRGLHLFRTKARCINCHHGPHLTDGRFHDLGLSYYGRELEDLGRYEVTGDPDDVGAFRTPTLRNVARTAPYMHNGLFALTGVLNMYAAGMPTLKPRPEQVDDPLFPTKSALLQEIPLTERDKADLIAFLESLTERGRRDRIDLPAFDDAGSR
jgi:cytochrome c peroxidase